MITTAVIVIVGSFVATNAIYCHKDIAEVIVVIVRKLNVRKLPSDD